MPKSMIKIPGKEARSILEHCFTYRQTKTALAEEIGVSRTSVNKYINSGLESAPFWVVCKIMKHLHVPDEDRLKIIRLYTGE